VDTTITTGGRNALLGKAISKILWNPGQILDRPTMQRPLWIYMEQVRDVDAWLMQRLRRI
jgi:hypothetical protein